MKTTATFQARRAGGRGPLAPSMILAGVIVLAVSLAVGWNQVRVSRTELTVPKRVDVSAPPVAMDWGFVLRADTASVLRHRVGLTPIDLVRTHAFGWLGPTVPEVLHDPWYLRELRLNPSVTPLALIRLEAPKRKEA